MNIFNRNSRFFIGDIVYPRPNRFGPRIQTGLQLVYVHEGDITVRVDDRAYEVRTGEATLLLPGRTEFFRFARTGRTHHGWCAVGQPKLSNAVVRQLSARPDVLPFTASMKTLVSFAWPLAHSRDRGDQLYRDALIQTLFREFISRTGCETSHAQPIHPSVEKARHYMESNLGEKLEIAVIAKHVGITPTHLIRLFREQLGDTPKQILWKMRCEEAARLLTETGLHAAEIAYQTGFANPQHFSRVFRRTMGNTPGAFRKAGWKQKQGG